MDRLLGEPLPEILPGPKGEDKARAAPLPCLGDVGDEGGFLLEVAMQLAADHVLLLLLSLWPGNAPAARTGEDGAEADSDDVSVAVQMPPLGPPPPLPAFGGDE